MIISQTSTRAQNWSDLGLNKDNLLQRELNQHLWINVLAIYQLSYLALSWQSPYFVNIYWGASIISSEQKVKHTKN